MSQPATAQNPSSKTTQVAALPFPIAARMMSRFSFTTGAIALSAAAATQINPIQIPAVGYIRHITLEVILTGAGGTAPAFTADGPFNVLQSVEFRTAAGNDLIVPLTGYQIFLANKYGSQYAVAPFCDPRMGKQYSATSPSAHFYLVVPLEIDCETGLGSIPALASNRSYQLALILAGIGTVFTGAPTATVQVNGTAWYWNEPPATSPGGTVQAIAPQGLGTISQWQLETPPLTPGDKYIKSNNVGNVLRTVIFTLRNVAGVRIDTNGWPPVCELYLDNEPMFYFTNNEWEDVMAKNYGLTAVGKDVAQGLDTGVYVVPFHALPGGMAGDPANSRSQYLPTLDASQLQLRGTAFGSAASTLEILTNSVIPTTARDIYSK